MKALPKPSPYDTAHRQGRGRLDEAAWFACATGWTAGQTGHHWVLTMWITNLR